MGDQVAIQHKSLAAGRWDQLSFCAQMANVGSEISRALNWREKGKEEYARKALVRALELLDLTIKPGERYPRLKELLRVRECLLDFFLSYNEFGSSPILWRKYFDSFARAALKEKSLQNNP